jgi:hypothetical protein
MVFDILPTELLEIIFKSCDKASKQALSLTTSRFSDIINDQNLCYLAAEYNCLDVLKYARKKGYSWNKNSNSICFDAITYNNFNMLKYAIKNGCPFDKQTLRNYAAKKGRFECLKYLCESQNCSWDYVEYTLAFNERRALYKIESLEKMMEDICVCVMNDKKKY